MKIFNTDNEMKERLEAATTENTELSELVAQREGDIKDITANLAEVSASIETLTAELEESKAASALLETEKAELAAQLEASKEAQVEFDEKVSNAALARMQELGVSEPVAAIAEDDTDDIYTQYTNLINNLYPKNNEPLFSSIKVLTEDGILVSIKGSKLIDNSEIFKRMNLPSPIRWIMNKNSIDPYYSRFKSDVKLSKNGNYLGNGFGILEIMDLK